MLESYRPPAELKSRRHLLRPVFRDIAELTASHSLSDKIKDAVQSSRKLIVLCSPAAKTSKWVDAEIRLFRRLHGEDAILCAIVEGTPETAFSPALTEGGREPLAADLTGALRFGRNESFRYGMLQLAASMLGVGLDDLVRREAKRRRRMGSAVTLGALAFSGVMGISTYSAVKAREIANANRAEAEGLVEYMITDLKTNLEPVGRLDILDGVGSKVMAYYAGQDIAKMPDERIARQARAQHLLGQVALNAGRYEDAQNGLGTAYTLTKEILGRSPNNPQAIFAHAQSAFWVGEVYKVQRQTEKTAAYWQEYHDLAYRLYDKDNSNFDWVMEAAWAENNLGIIARYDRDYEDAKQHYASAIELFDQALQINPNAEFVLIEKVNALTGAEQAMLAQGHYKAALSYRRQIVTLSIEQHLRHPSNKNFHAYALQEKSNILWQYHPFISEEERQDLRVESIESFKALNQHDPQNILWANNYYEQLFANFRFAQGLQQKKLAFAEIQKAFPNEPKIENSPMAEFNFKNVQTRIWFYTGKENKARDNLAALIENYNAGIYSGQGLEVDLALLANDIGEDVDVDALLRSYFDTQTAETAALFPDAFLRDAQAYMLKGECQKAKDTIKSLLEAADKTHPDLKKIINCET